MNDEENVKIYRMTGKPGLQSFKKKRQANMRTDDVVQAL